MSSYSKFVDFDKGLDIPEPKRKVVDSTLMALRLEVGHDDPIKFKEYLSRNDDFAKLLQLRIRQQYKTIQDTQFDFNKPNIEQSLVFHEGYKKALRDIHKLIPRQ
jgi:hypothetical protein